eukprot:Pgem_evm1s12774
MAIPHSVAKKNAAQQKIVAARAEARAAKAKVSSVILDKVGLVLFKLGGDFRCSSIFHYLL